MKKYILKCKCLSPVHIGGSRQIEPYEYNVRDNIFYMLDLNRIISGLEGEELSGFMKIIDSGDLKSLRKYIATFSGYPRCFFTVLISKGNVSQRTINPECHLRF